MLMQSESVVHWAILAVLAAMYVAMCIRIAWRAGRDGHSRILWFLITFFATAIPACILFMRDRAKARASRGESSAGEIPAAHEPSPPVRCRHCGRLVSPVAASGGGWKTCPNCGMVVDEGRLA